MIEYEKEFEKTQKERQETFGKAFEEDLENYKQTGAVPTLSKLNLFVVLTPFTFHSIINSYGKYLSC